jgi:glycosyltransferase involved in cell wall biosynthesis
LNILIATVFPLPGGGIWSFVSNLQKSLIEVGHKVDILCGNKFNSRVEILGTNKVVDFMPFRHAVNEQLLMNCPGITKDSWVYRAELNHYLFEQAVSNIDLRKYDIIHTQDVIAAASISRVKKTGTPLVTSVHGFLSGAIFHQIKPVNQWENSRIWSSFVLQYYSRLEQIGYESSDYIHTSSMWMRRIIETQFSIPSTKISTYTYGLDLTEFVPSKSRDRITEKPIILAVSRLVYLKGLEHLIDALSLLSKENDSWECWILGEGEMERTLKSRVNELGLQDKILFRGVKKNLKDILQRAEMVVLPSLQENQPFAVIEAQLMGVPVVVSNAGGMPEMVDNGKSGFIVDKGNSVELYKKIRLLLDNPSIKDQMSQYSLSYARSKWNINNTRKHTLQMYNKALIGKKSLK